MPVDLHLHTTASDGSLTPAVLVEEAKRAGLNTIAITDHDSTAGVAEAQATGKRLGVQVIPGVEINTDYRKTEVHILGYFVEYGDQRFLSALEELRSSRVERARKMVARLHYLGYKIEFERVKDIAGSGAIGRPHIALALVEKGLINNVSEAFDRLLGRNRPAYVPRFKLTPCDAVRLIIDASGIPVFAHPGLSDVDSLIPSLMEAGLAGLEVWHSDHDECQVEHYLKMARELDLVPTAGSDWHGPDRKHHIELGDIKGEDWIVDQLKSRHQRIFQVEDTFA